MLLYTFIFIMSFISLIGLINSMITSAKNRILEENQAKIAKEIKEMKDSEKRHSKLITNQLAIIADELEIQHPKIINKLANG